MIGPAAFSARYSTPATSTNASNPAYSVPVIALFNSSSASATSPVTLIRIPSSFKARSPAVLRSAVIDCSAAEICV